MITHADEGPEFEPDDPLAVILRPGSDYLGPPPGRYAEIRRGALRRRLLRGAAGAGLTCAVALLVALPLLSSAPDEPVSPTVPLAPPAPPASPTPTPTRPVSPEPAEDLTTPGVPTEAPAATASDVAPVPQPR